MIYTSMKYIFAILLMLCTNAYTFGQATHNIHVDFTYPVNDGIMIKNEPFYASFSEKSIYFSESFKDSYVKMRRIEIEDTASIRYYWNIVSKLFIDKTVNVVNSKPKCNSSEKPILKICVHGDNYSRQEYEYKINLCYTHFPENSGYSDEFIALLSFLETNIDKLNQMK